MLRASLASAAWISVDDTSARHARTDGVTTQVGDARFTAFRTTASKSRLNYLALLRAGHGDFVVNDAALAAHPVKVFANTPAWRAHLTALGFDARAITPNPVQVATEGTLWGAIRHHGLMKTCAKLRVSFFRHLGDRLGIPDGDAIPPLPDLVRNAATV